MSLFPREHWFDMTHFFDDAFNSKRGLAEKEFFAPKVDIIEKDQHFEVIAELPGVNKGDISVQLHDGVLTLEAKTEQESSSENDKVIRKERRTGFFSRSFNVGKGISADDIQAKFDNGLLTLTAPKLQEAIADKRKIEIS